MFNAQVLLNMSSRQKRAAKHEMEMKRNELEMGQRGNMVVEEPSRTAAI